MKNTKLKAWSLAYFLFFTLFTGTLFAQNLINITGTFEGLRSQFDKKHEKITKEFQYKFDLVQKGNRVEGTSTIISEEGNYAEVGIRGVVIGKHFYFEEFEMKDQIKPNGMVWCYKSGVLNINIENDQITLSGETPSFMVNYGYACTGGVTKLSTSIEDLKNFKKLENIKEDNLNEDVRLNVFPNPAYNEISFSIYSKDETIGILEILDLNGRVVSKAITKKVSKGYYTEQIDIEKFTPGIYIIKMTINNKVFSKELLKL